MIASSTFLSFVHMNRIP